MRRTPLEAAIAAKTEKQGRYEARLRAQGMAKVCFWVPAENVETFRQMAAKARELHLSKGDGE